MKHFLILAVGMSSLLLSGYMTKPNTLPFADSKDHALTSSEMETSGGAGAYCRLGCNNTGWSCQLDWIDETHWRDVTKRIWNEHHECAWALFGDCTISGSALCNNTIHYQLNDVYCESEPAWDDPVYTSTCNPESGGGPG